MAGDATDGRLTSLRSVADGASLHFLGTVIVNGLGFLLNLVLTRTLGASVYGIYAYGTMVIASVLTFANFGTDVSATRYLSGNLGRRSYQNRILGLAYATTVAVSVVVSVGLFLAAPRINAYTLEEPLFTPAMQVFAIALPFQALTHVASSTVRGLELPVEKTVILLAGPTFQLLAIVAAVAVGYSVIGVAAAYAVACLLAFLFALVYSLRRTGLRPSWEFRRAEAVDFYDYSAPLTLSKASSFLFKRVDVFMVGIFLLAADVGVYNVAVLLAGIVAMPLGGINQLFPPVASRLHADGDRATLETVYATVTRWSITASVIIALPLFLYREPVLAVFGPEFVVGGSVVALFVLGQLFNAAAGPANDLLTMTDHQYAVMTNHVVFGLLNVVLNYLLILQLGLVGAAVATAGVLAGLNVVRVIEVWYFEGLVPYTTELWKPVVATGVAGAAMTALAGVLDGYVLVIVGATVGGCAFVLSLAAFGVAEQDRELARDYLDLV